MKAIEIDEATAETLSARAAERGVTIPELIAELAVLDSKPISTEPGDIEELDRRWRAIEGGQPTASSDEVVRWLRTWGTPAFRPWHDR